MDILAILPDWALPYYHRLTPEQWWLFLNALCALVVVTGAAVAVYAFLRAFGFRRFQGRWYSPRQFHSLVQELYSGVREGRVPDYETMCLLDEYVYGRNGSRIRNLTKADHI